MIVAISAEAPEEARGIEASIRLSASCGRLVTAGHILSGCRRWFYCTLWVSRLVIALGSLPSAYGTLLLLDRCRPRTERGCSWIVAVRVRSVRVIAVAEYCSCWFLSLQQCCSGPCQ